MNPQVPELQQSIRDGNTILFVGAGISRTVGLPNFKELIDKIAVDLGYDPEVFHILGEGDYLSLAEFYLAEKGKIGDLRSWMDRAWHPYDLDISKSDIHRLIVELEFPIIYTTNYDRLLEMAFECHKRAAVKIASVGDLISLPQDSTQIIKFHGDLGDDGSIVIGESDYFKRLSFETPLDIKLRSDMLGKSVLFIGYSLSDINVRYLLYRLQQLWQGSTEAKFQPKSYIFLNQPNVVRQRLFERRGVHAIFSEADNPTEGLKQFLESLL